MSSKVSCCQFMNFIFCLWLLVSVQNEQARTVNTVEEREMFSTRNTYLCYNCLCFLMLSCLIIIKSNMETAGVTNNTFGFFASKHFLLPWIPLSVFSLKLQSSLWELGNMWVNQIKFMFLLGVAHSTRKPGLALPTALGLVCSFQLNSGDARH